MKLYSQRILQAHLKAAYANANPKLLKELAKPTQRKRNFKNAPPHDKKTMKMIATNRPTKHGRQGSTGGNTVLPKWRQKCFYETFVLNSTAVILLNFSAKIRHFGNTQTVVTQ